MASLNTKYLSLDLKSPVIVSAGPLTQNIVSLKKCEEAGAGAVVLKSIFEEQIESDVSNEYDSNEEYLTHSTAEAAYKAQSRDFYIDKYMKLLVAAKKELSIPVIASICCKSRDNWAEYASRFIACGADAIELNYYPIASDASVPGSEVDKALESFVKFARKKITCPLSIKIGYKYSSLANTIRMFDREGIDAAVLFNRFFRPDIDIESMSFINGIPTSSPNDYGEALRWIGLMSGEVKMDLAGNTGIYSGETAIKMLLAGAKAVEVCSVVIKDGFSAITKINRDIESWMERKNFADIASFCGKLAEERNSEGYKWERTQFLKTIN